MLRLVSANCALASSHRAFDFKGNAMKVFAGANASFRQAVLPAVHPYLAQAIQLIPVETSD